MDNNQIETALNRVFHDENERIVFWNDPEREFQNEVPFLDLGSVNLIRLNEIGALEVKCLIEKGDPGRKYLLYAPAEEPDYENDWLLDIRLYSRAFRADRASLVLDELGLQSQQLRPHIASRRKFFDNKERIQKLKPLVSADDTAADLDRKMIAVLVRAEQDEFFNIVRTLYHGFTESGDAVDLDVSPLAWEQVEKFDLSVAFWEMARQQFGYSDDFPSLKKLLIRMLLTDFAHHLKADVPSALANLVLPPQGRTNTVVCLAQWRDSGSKVSSYDQLSKEAGALLSKLAFQPNET